MDASPIELSDAAIYEARVHFRLTPDGARQLLRKLTPKDFSHDELSHHAEHEGNILMFFDVDYRTRVVNATIRIVITETPNWYVVKFHRSIEDEDYDHEE